MSDELVRVLENMVDGEVHTALSLADGLQRQAKDVHADLLRLWGGRLVSKGPDANEWMAEGYRITERGQRYIKEVRNPPRDAYPFQLVVRGFATAYDAEDALDVAAAAVWDRLGVTFADAWHSGGAQRVIIAEVDIGDDN